MTNARVEINDEIRVDTYPKEMRARLALEIRKAKGMGGMIIVRKHDSALFGFSIEIYDSADFLYELWFTEEGEIIWD